ncbi:MAG TPA: aspartate aminotransferase family protein [Negativicutes bacterium]
MNHYLGPEEVLRKKSEYLIPCVYHFYDQPMQLVRGEMQYLYDHTGKKYLDCFAGVSVVNCGHCNPEITKAICDQVTTLQHTCTIYLTQNIVDLAERLSQITPGCLQKSFFCSSGSEANEGAALLASIYTGRHEFISLRQGLHGRTKLGMSLTGLSLWRTDPSPVGGISFAPNAYCYRCLFGKQYPECDLACADEIETVIKTATSGQVAALFAEPIQGNGGIITPPPGYFKRVKEILDKYGILLIIDEVQTGFGRTGKMFAIEHYDVEPDIMTMAKALANGTPVGAFIATAEIANKYTRPGASTLGGNPVTAAAALATLNVLANHDLPSKAAKLGAHFKAGLLTLQKKHPLIGDVRGLGLMLGVELVYADKSPASHELDIVLEKMKDRGFLVGKNGPHRNVLAFQPPLVITLEDIDNLLNHLDDVLSALKL